MHTPEQPLKVGVICSTFEYSFQGKTPSFRDLQETVKVAEEIGLDSYWLPDHLLYRFGDEEAGCWEVMTALAALAPLSTNIQLGTLVACTSFRSPALLARMAATMDEISNGRFILGLGAGWHQPEYEAFGFPFDHLFSRFEEALQIITSLLREGKVDFEGRYYQLSNCVSKPQGPSPKGPRIMIGSRKPRMTRLVARYADAWNTHWHTSAEQVKEPYAQLLAACKEVGRDPNEVELTAGIVMSLLKDDEKGENKNAISGTPEQIAQSLREFANEGVKHVIIQFEPQGVEGLERLAPAIKLLKQG
ncbi:LLM class flavin-dependent oxidoreductase [Ktedonosporobacter rubrisoli]|uniref:LLM class flavin-dependent oxidoreductase n=1 Tax=Ktedonosporobacter rubrisoli TaxID=2509675 RepID=A0A4P6JIW7_KTERU|nr:LLM class flavin-dependent oxidoreductase [Ktedonosporobacter rubrisoli]QBD75035.1 LLM class flavin-dependent oxidoreductase [Ktedonosporobacter rubrisoli]